jgi:hypothetical protein
MLFNLLGWEAVLLLPHVVVRQGLPGTDVWELLFRWLSGVVLMFVGGGGSSQVHVL